ncbi:MAG: metallophosphoesterase [Elusimicrobiota bacterium]
MRILSIFTFLTIFLSAYFGFNLLMYFFIIRGIPSVKIYLRVLLPVLAVSYPLGAILDRIAPNTIPFILTYIGSIWLGFTTIGISIFSIFYILLLFSKIFSISITQNSVFIFYSTVLLLILTLCFSVFAIYEAHHPAITNITIQAPTLNTDELKILHLSDMHAGTMIREKELLKIIALCKNTNPDLIVITGDFVDADMGRAKPLIHILKEFSVIAPVYAVPGNHEFYAGIDKIEQLFKESNIPLLRNEVLIFHNLIDIVALDDEEHSSFIGKMSNTIDELFGKCSGSRPIIFLTHRPANFKKAADLGALLQLSGHTHNGQIFPGNLIIKMIFEYPQGLNKYKNSYIYTNRGAGTWGPPMRLFSPPEIALITLKRKS